MKIAVILHSKTGFTLKLGELIASKLKAKGHSVDLVQLRTEPGEVSGTARQHSEFSITNLPDVSGYDAVLVGGPTWAFSSAPVILEAIKAMGDLSGKKAAAFTTQGFPFAFLGGNQSLSLMGKELKNKGAEVLPGRSVQMMLHDQAKSREKAAEGIAALF